MRKRIKWSEDFKRYPGHRQPYKGFRGVGKAILHGLLVLCAFCAIYAFFHKTELNSGVVESSAVEIKPVETEVGNLDSLDGASSEEGSKQDGEDVG